MLRRRGRRHRAGWLVLLAALLASCRGPADDIPVRTSPPTLDLSQTFPQRDDGVPCPDAAGPLSQPLAFSSGAQLSAIDPQGGPPQRLLTLEHAQAWDLAWSPAGTTLAYVLAYDAGSDGTPRQTKICGLDRATGQGRVLVNQAGVLFQRLSWSADGTALIVVHEPALVRFALDGSPGRVVLNAGISPTLAPDGQRLAFVRPDPDTLLLADAQGQHTEVLLDPEDSRDILNHLRWSPDGAHIAFIHTRYVPHDYSPGGSQYNDRPQYTLEWITLTTQQISGYGVSRGTINGTSALAWSPDGQQLAVADLYQGLVVFDLARQTSTVLSVSHPPVALSWRPR